MNGMRKKFFLSIFSSMLACGWFIYGEQSPYKLAGEQALHAEDHVKTLRILTPQEKAAIEKDIRKYNFTLVPLSDFEKKEICFNLFSQHLPQTPSSPLNNQQAVQELHILCGDTNSKKSNLLTRFKPVTSAGHVVLARILMQPTSDRAVIEQRQALVKGLVSNPDLLSKLEKELQQIKDAESIFFSFWKEQDDINQKALQQVYFPQFFKRLNNNSKALEFLRACQTLWQTTGFLPPFWFFAYAQDIKSNYDAYKHGNQGIVTSAYKTLTEGTVQIARHAICNHITSQTGIVDNPNPSAMAAKSVTIGDSCEAMRRQFGNPTIAALCSYGIIAALDAWWIYRSYQSLGSLKFQKNIGDHLHIQTHSIAQTVNAIKNITDLLARHNTLKENMPSFDQLDTICNHAHKLSAKMYDFIKLITKDTFKGSPTALSLRGRVFAAAHLMPEVKNDFIPALETIGELDACIAIAKNMITFEHEPVHYCFAEFVDSETPFVDIQHGWNPLVNPQHAVPLTVAMGINTAVPNAMLTGPHGCGKSTTMETVAYNVWLAHCYGVGFASSLKLSPFTKLRTYMDIKQNREEGLSTFMAEAHRVDQIELELTTLKPTERCLTVMDEVFKGTMEKEGAKRLYKFGKKVIEIPQNICIFATHFALPTTLEEESNGKIINFHVGLEEPTPGQFIPTYNVIKGVNSWWFDDKEKRERYIDWLRARIQTEYPATA